MTKYDDRDDDGDNDRFEDGKDDDNAAAGSGSDGPIFDLITTHRSRLVLVEEDRVMTVTALRLRRTTYLCVGL